MTVEPPTPKKQLGAVSALQPSALLPKVSAEATPWFQDAGDDHYLVDGLRVSVDAEGGVRRATARFADAATKAIRLPPRFGEGYLFYDVSNAGTQLWRAPRWVAPVEPIARVWLEAEEVIVGFDRLYLRTSSKNLVAVDFDTGSVLPRGPLPLASAWGELAFSDGWRAVVRRIWRPVLDCYLFPGDSDLWNGNLVFPVFQRRQDGQAPLHA
ncbi:MAG: hypothetical protein AAGA56_18155, partial [Myxococcota bacterium]